MPRLLALARPGHALSVVDQLARVERWGIAAGHEITRLTETNGGWSSPPIIDAVSACKRGEVDLLGVVDLARLGTSSSVLVAVLMCLAASRVRIAVVGTQGAEIHDPASPDLWCSDAMLVAGGQLAFEELRAWSRDPERRRRVARAG